MRNAERDVRRKKDGDFKMAAAFKTARKTLAHACAREQNLALSEKKYPVFEAICRPEPHYLEV